MKLTGGANLVERPPVFSADGKLLLVCTGCTVSIYSVATGVLVNQLEGHTGDITSLNVVHYSGAVKSVINHVWTSSLDGTVRFWDFNTGSNIKTVTIGSPIISMVIPGLSHPEVTLPSKQCIGFLLIQANGIIQDIKVDKHLNSQNIELNGKIEEKKLDSGDKQRFHVVLHNLTNGKPFSFHLAKTSAPRVLVCSQLGGLVGMADSRKIWVWRLPKKNIEGVKSLKVTVLHHTKALQAVALDPSETIVAGSDDSGQILIWKNVGEHSFVSDVQRLDGGTMEKLNQEVFDSSRGARGHDDAVALTTYHWHSDKVNFLKFSVDGTYLFSGGKEAVFVIWQLETGKCQFLSRLGSSLLHCASSPDASIFSISCGDNTIRMVNIGTMSVQKSIQGIKPYSPVSECTRGSEVTKIAIEPGSRCLVLPTEGSLQFYSAFYDRHMGEVEICPRNYVSVSAKGRKNDGMSDPPVFVSHVAFSADGSVMATAECRFPEDGIGGGSCLKFWRRNSCRIDFTLNTQIDEPHCGEVSSLVYHPSSNMAVSCCHIGEFKVWVQDEVDKGITSWRCRSVGSYQQKPMHCASFSLDGTLLAVAAGELITLWNPVSNGLVHVLASIHPHPVKFLSFVPTTNHLVCASIGERPALTLWSLESLSICWSYDMEVKGLSVDFRSGHFAVLVPSLRQSTAKRKTRQGVIAVFSAESPLPPAVWSVQDVEGSISFCLSSNDTISERKDEDQEKTSEDSHLMYLNQWRQYVLFDPFVAEDETDGIVKQRFSKLGKQGPSALESVFGKTVKPAAEVNSDISKVKTVRPWRTLLNCPSHLISLPQIGLPYIESLLEKRTEV